MTGWVTGYRSTGITILLYLTIASMLRGIAAATLLIADNDRQAISGAIEGREPLRRKGDATSGLGIGHDLDPGSPRS